MTRTLWRHRRYDRPALVDTDTGETYWRPHHFEIDLTVDLRYLFFGIRWESHPSEREIVICPIPCVVVTIWWIRRRETPAAGRRRRTA